MTVALAFCCMADCGVNLLMYGWLAVALACCVMAEWLCVQCQLADQPAPAVWKLPAAVSITILT